jgi:hypothetical protein
LGVLSLSSIALNLLVLVFIFFLASAYWKLNKKPPPTLVQLSSGEAVNVAPLGNQERTPPVILEFVRESLSMLMTWQGEFPPEEEGAKPLPDPGVDIRPSGVGGRMTVTTPAYQAAFALSEDFRKEFLQELGKLTPAGVFQGKTEVVFVPIDIGQPILIEPGKWRVKVVANLLVLDRSDILGKPIPFNKEVFVRAVSPPEYQANVTGIAKIVQQIRASGLEIYAIRDLTQGDL